MQIYLWLLSYVDMRTTQMYEESYSMYILLNKLLYKVWEGKIMVFITDILYNKYK